MIKKSLLAILLLCALCPFVYSAPNSYVDGYFSISENITPGKTFVHKFGRNPDIDIASGFEAIWNGGGDYTGFDAVAGEAIEVFSSSALDAGTLVTSGTATGGSETTLIDAAATFVTDSVAIGDAILNDTDISHGIVTEVTSETTLTVFRFTKSDVFSSSVEIDDSYRVVTPASTGAAVVEIGFLLDSDFDNETSEFIILNGTTGVDSVGTDYIRNSKQEVITAGSNNSNVGTITARQKTTTANIFAVVPIGYNKDMIAAYTIPKGMDGHLTFWKPVLSGKKNAFSGARLLFRHKGEVFMVAEETAVAATGNSADPRPYLVAKDTLPEGTDIKIMNDTDVNDTAISGMFDLILSSHED
jgi:hypothetical protein